jgi:hypothetical protein
VHFVVSVSGRNGRQTSYEDVEAIFVDSDDGWCGLEHSVPPTLTNVGLELGRLAL